jgi:uncharacterized protein (TIGR03437 family)
VFVDIGPATIVLRPQGNGAYGGSWTPLSTATGVTLLFTALVPSALVQATYFTDVRVAPGEPALPVIDNDGVVEAAGAAIGWPLSPGGIISVFGVGLANGEATAQSIPLPRSLANVRLQIGNEDAPLFSVRPDQIRALVPLNVTPGDSVAVRVINNGRMSAPQTHLIFPVRPGIQQVDGVAVAFDGNGNQISFQNPARPGGTLWIRAYGLGRTDPSPATGDAAPPSSAVLSPVRVLIGDLEVPVTAAGLVPGQVGVYQVGVLLPNNVPTGPEVSVVLRQAGITSDSSGSVGIPISRQ